MVADEPLCLRIRNLPSVLSTEAITSLLTHYGATRVCVLPRRNTVSSGKEPGATTSKKLQKAIATFTTREAQQKAQKRLNLLELAGQCLQVEVVGDDKSSETKWETGKTGDHVPLKGQPPLPKGLPPPMPHPMQSRLYAPAPLAPHLGLNYAPSPLLEYKYPKATESIVRNIANALMVLPRFYTQVLHLMNKMNLPPPFEEDAIPGRFSIKQDVSQQNDEARDLERKAFKRSRTDEKVMKQIVEEEEEEEDQDAVREDNLQPLDIHPTHELRADRGAKTDPKQSDRSQAQLELIGKSIPRRKKLPSIKKSATLTTAFQLDNGKSSYHGILRSIRPGVISENEVNRQRLPYEELRKEPLMDSYVRGVPSSSILVKNVADAMDEKDLRSVFGYVLPQDVDLDAIAITRLPAKGSAHVSYPNKVLATAAVDALHGVRIEGKTLIVSFSNISKALSDASVATTRWTLQDLDSKRLPEARLALEKAMRNYQRGEPSDTLYVKNLANTVKFADLIAVFGAVLPRESGPDALDIRHFTVGRMKCQAFVKYPTLQLASKALHQVHGVVLKDKPLVVCFRKPQPD